METSNYRALSLPGSISRHYPLPPYARAAEREMAELLQQKETLLQEMQHRVANSLQIIAGNLLLKARTVQSEETRRHLRDAHQRVMSVAAVQQQLLGSPTASRSRSALISRDCARFLAIVRDAGNLDDRRQSSGFIEGSGGRRHGLIHRGGKHRSHCRRARDQCVQACLCRRPGLRRTCRCV